MNQVILQLATTMESAALENLTLKVLVEKERDRVVFVEASTDFIDVLFSFMTMPIGTIIRLTRDQLPKLEIGCLYKLYSSIENLDEEYLQSTKFRDILLQPRSAAEIYCDSLKLKLAESCTKEYFACPSSKCDFASQYQNTHCRCGEILDHMIKLSDNASLPRDEGVFLKPTARFMISDDFQVVPMSIVTGLSLLSKLKPFYGSKIEARTINIGRDEVLKLLKCSLTSKTPFSDTIMDQPIGIPNCQFHSQRVKDSSKLATKINLKLIVSKSKNKALYAEVEENFVELLCSFLTIPLGYVFEEFPSLDFKGCMGNLYKSIQDIDSRKFFKSEEMRATLLNPKLAPGLPLMNQLLGIKEAENPSYSTLKSLFPTTFHKPDQGEAITSKGFIKGQYMFMVTDSLTIAPLSPLSAICSINKTNVPLGDIGEQEVVMGEDEASRLLGASLVSESALTDVFMKKKSKQPQ